MPAASIQSPVPEVATPLIQKAAMMAAMASGRVSRNRVI